MDIILNKWDSPEGHDLRAEIVDYWMSQDDNLTVKEAQNTLQGWQRAVGSIRKGAAIDQVQFSALRKAEGYGLPVSVREKDLIRTLHQYGQRVARDLAFFEIIQNDPVARKIFAVPEQGAESGQAMAESEKVLLPDGSEAEELAGIDKVAQLLNNIYNPYGSYLDVSPKVRAGMRLVSSSIFGVGTALRDVLSITSQSLPYMGARDIGGFYKALKNVAQDYKRLRTDALEKGVLRENLQDIYFGESSAADKVADRIEKIANALYKYGGRGTLENFGRVYTYALGEQFAELNLLRARSGDKESLRLLKEFSKDIPDKIDLTNPYRSIGAKFPCIAGMNTSL